MSSLTPRIDKLDGNLIINGNFDFWQRNTTGTLSGATNLYVADRFVGSHGSNIGAATTVMSRSTDVPTFAQSGTTSVYSMQLQPGVATPSPNADTAGLFGQIIEGNFFKQIHQKKITISFWVKYTSTATFALVLSNTDNSRHYVVPFTINAANTWEKKVFNIQLDQVGTWVLDNGRGLGVFISLMAGTSRQTSNTNTWFNNPVGGFYQQGVTGQTNFYSSTSNIMKIAQVQVIEGTFSDPEFKTAGRNYIAELELCKRYYERVASSGDNFAWGNGATNNQISFSVPYQVEKRTATLTPSWDGDGNNWRLWGQWNTSNYYYALTNGGTSFTSYTNRSLYVTMTSTNAMANYISGTVLAASVAAYIAVDADF